MMMIYVREIEDYIDYVDKHPLEVDQEIKLFIKNIAKPTLSRDDVFFDETTYYKFLSFTQRWFFELFPFQKFIYAFFFMYDRKNTSRVIFREVFIMMGRGNGKDAMIAPLALFLTTPAHGIMNYHIDIVATSESQAEDTFLVMYEMLEANKDKMRKHFYWNKEVIINRETRSRIRYNTAGAKTKDGKKVGLVIFNEKHAYETQKEINVFTSALGKVAHARIVTITTNGTVREGPLDSDLEMSQRILNGEYNFTGLCPIIYKISDKNLVDEPFKKFLETKNEEDIDWTYYIQANPAIMYLPNLRFEIQNEYLDMKLYRPSLRSEFYAKRVNLPEQDEEEVVTTWDKITKACFEDEEKKIERKAKDIKGKMCIIGVDFADLNDFASAGLLFMENEEIIWRSHTWICSNGKYFKSIRFPFDKKGIDGYNDFEIVNTNTINPQSIVDWILSQFGMYNVKKIVMDTYRFNLLRKPLEESGLTIETKQNPEGLVRMIRYPASIAAIVAPQIDVYFNEFKLNLGNSAIMRWAINNTVCKTLKDGNKKYEKIEPLLRKNDPFMAFVAAVSVIQLLEIQVVYG